MTEREALKLILDRLESMNHEDSIFAGEFDIEIKAINKALAQPEQEPVAWVCMTDQYSKIVRFEWETFGNVTPLYTTPPQRKPLTEKVIMDSTRELLTDVRWPSTFIDVWRLCEAAHGIKEKNT